jgi:hypothetical protein
VNAAAAPGPDSEPHREEEGQADIGDFARLHLACECGRLRSNLLSEGGDQDLVGKHALIPPAERTPRSLPP